MLSAEAKKEPNKVSPTSQVKVSPIKDIKNRFTEPPAPPPQQPLPEKPDGPSLRRSETEKPMGSSSPVRADSRISSLSDALSSAKKEIEAQNIRVRDLEALLTQERRAREDAEERASRLEQESLKTNSELAPGEESDKTLQEHASVPEQDGSSRPLSGSPSAPSIVDVATGRLQRRLENMMLEMSEMKQQMEVYRRRAEEAEAQSAADRKTLAEMIESIRENDAKKSSRGSKRRSRSDSELALPSPTPSSEAPLAGDEAEEGEITIVNENDLQADMPISQTTGHEQNGQPFSHETSTDLSNTARPLATRQPSRNELAITHGGPAVSILTVVALGVAVMAWLNSYPKVER
jgi:vacuolar-type H+-ATPase subunit I/STV1